MELIYELIEIFDLFHLEQIEYSQINLPSANIINKRGFLSCFNRFSDCIFNF